MGFTVASFDTSATVTSPAVGVGIGGLAVVVALIAVLGAFYLSGANERPSSDVRSTLAVVVIPLSLTFAAIVVFEGFAAV